MKRRNFFTAMGAFLLGLLAGKPAEAIEPEITLDFENNIFMTVPLVLSKSDIERNTPAQFDRLRATMLENLKDSVEFALDEELERRGYHSYMAWQPVPGEPERRYRVLFNPE